MNFRTWKEMSYKKFVLFFNYEIKTLITTYDVGKKKKEFKFRKYILNNWCPVK